MALSVASIAILVSLDDRYQPAMKLYYSPGVSSLAPHIALLEAGLDTQLVLAPTKTKVLPDGSDYRAIHPLGMVPLLELGDGQHLTEIPAMLQYIADQAPGKNLAPDRLSHARYQLQSWLSFVGSELHKGIAPLFAPGLPDAVRNIFSQRFVARMAWVDQQLQAKPYLMGDAYTVADTYLYVVTRWCDLQGIDRGAWRGINAHHDRVGGRPATLSALKAEGIAVA